MVRVKQNPDKAKGGEDVAYLDVGNYNVPQGDGNNELGTIGYSYEELYAVSGPINSPQKVLWINTTQEWLHLAADLEVVKNDICINFYKLNKEVMVPLLKGCSSFYIWLQKMELLHCVNSSLCLPKKPKLVVGLKAATANIFVDNAAYRTFLYDTFGVSSSDMESSAVAMVRNIIHFYTL